VIGPAVLGWVEADEPVTLVAALLQATSLPFIVAAAQIGLELGKLNEATAAALVGAGILSVLLFPLLAVVLLRREPGHGGAAPGRSSPPRGDVALDV